MDNQLANQIQGNPEHKVVMEMDEDMGLFVNMSMQLSIAMLMPDLEELTEVSKSIRGCVRDVGIKKIHAFMVAHFNNCKQVFPHVPIANDPECKHCSCIDDKCCHCGKSKSELSL